jgi:hypothetical protein
MRPKKTQVKKFAVGVASGLSIRQAAREAGYADSTTRIYRRAKRKDFVAMVDEIHEDRGLGVTTDLAPTIALMLRRSQEAALLNTPAGITLAGQLLLAVARLQEKLPKPPNERQVSLKAWAAMYAPED